MSRPVTAVADRAVDATSPMTPLSPTSGMPSAQLIERLGAICDRRAVHDLAARLRELRDWLARDIESFQLELSSLPRGGSLAQTSAHHLLDLGGKCLRPMCVALAAKMGTGFGRDALDCAVAVELIHNASLLHDDVIDLGPRRRGAPTARAIYGNAASVVGGNWLLITALERVERTRLPGIVGRTLRTIGAMIAAEAIQLENRGRLDLSRVDYFRVIHGKTAALFGWALFHGGLAGGLPRRDCEALERFGHHLGVAFQLVDDLLDCTGDAGLTGKALFADLREGTTTYPLLLALERDASLRSLAAQVLDDSPGAAAGGELGPRLRDTLFATGSVRDCRALADRRTRSAIACLEPLPAGPGREALVALAEVMTQRKG
jgi:octaprenyl-diphosphate synthase